MAEAEKVAPPVWSEKTVKLAELRPYERNPRLITKEAYDRLKAALEGMKFAVIVECNDEQHKLETIEKLMKEGFACKALIS